VSDPWVLFDPPDPDRAALVEAANLASGCGDMDSVQGSPGGEQSRWTKKSAAVLAECMRRKLGIALANVDGIDEQMGHALHDAAPLRVHDVCAALADVRLALAVLTALAAELEGKRP